MSRYVYLGGDAVRNEDDIVGVFDLDNTSWSHLTRDFLARAERKGSVESAAEDIPRSFVLCAKGEKTVILTQPSPATLAKRLDDQDQERFLIWQN